MNRKSELARRGKRKGKSPGQMKYADFFDPPDEEPSGNQGSENESKDEDENEDGEEMSADEEEDPEDDQAVASSEAEMDSDEENTISNFEKKQQKVIRCT